MKVKLLRTGHNRCMMRIALGLLGLALVGALWLGPLPPAYAQEPGTVKAHQKISDTAGGFTGTLDDGDRFGVSVTALGDLDSDGVTDLAVGAQCDDDGGTDRGAVWVLFMNTDGTVKSHQKISDTAGGFAGTLDDGDLFGRYVAALDDLDGDNVLDLVVGTYGDDDGGTDRGAVWILFLNPPPATVTETTTVTARADLVIAKADAPDPVIVGNPLTYTVTITNTGPSTATGVVLTDTLPLSVTFASATAGQGDCTPPAGSVVTCTLGLLASGGTATVTLVVTPTTAGPITNTANVAGNEPDSNMANNTATQDTAVAGPFTIINTNDSGPGSLRQVILNANASAGTDTITFNIPGAGPHTIQPTSALPTITDPVIIDGTTQLGFAGTPIIELDGSNAGLGVNGLPITAGNSTVKGLVINHFRKHGILLQANGGNLIQDNSIAYNDGNGVQVEGPTSTGNTITHNAIHDNGGQGIETINGGNAELRPPLLVGAVGNMVAGTAPPTSTVEIFGDDADEGRFFLGSTTADALGHFQFVASPTGLNVTATATDEAGNTSEFSSPVTRETAISDTFETNDDWTLAYPITATVSATSPAEDGAQARPTAARATYVSYISRADDVDFYKLPVPPRGSTVIFTLTNLPQDFDLALFSPTDVPSDTPLRDVPLKDAPLRDVPMRDIPLRDVPLKDVPLKDIPLKDVPLRDVPLRDVPLKDVSFRPGTGDEQVSDVALHAMDYYYVQVVGHNGAYSPAPYTLQVEVLPPPPPPTYTRTVTTTGTAGAVYQPFGGDTQTLIVINRQRTEQLYGTTAATDLMARLRDFADHPTVKGMILPVETDPIVADAYEDWDENVGDPEAANEVAGAIKKLLSTYTSATPSLGLGSRQATRLRAGLSASFGAPAFPNLTYLVIVGSDEVVPFRRVLDIVHTSNERDYRKDAHVQRESALYASLDRGYVLTDDFYADFEPTKYRGRPLYVANYSIGRLVETPDEIMGQLDYYLTSGGILTATTSLSVGYDFLTDSSLIISDTFGPQGLTNDALISDAWNPQDLIDFFLNNRHDINSVNAHFQHYRLEPGDRAGGLFQSDVIGQSDVLTGTVIFSMGCHAGLNVCDLISKGGPQSLDFAQAFARKRAVFVGNTGYGYGDTVAPTLSEELMSIFARNLGGAATVPVGQALLKAKQEYALNNMGSYGPYDEKVLIEATLYGPPMYRVSVPSPGAGERGSNGAGERGSNGAEEPFDYAQDRSAIRNPQFAIRNSQFVRSYTVTPTLTAVNTSEGTYYTADGGVQAMLYRPLQPRVSLDIALPGGVGDGEVAHGALFVAATYSDTQNFDPVITMPVSETTRYEPQWIYTGWRPQALARINQFGAPQGVLERLVLILGQFLHTDVVGNHVEGIQRLYSRVTYDVYYSTADDITPPTIESATAHQQGSTVRFGVEVSDASGVERVVATYTDGAGTWQSLELTYDADADQWIGELAGVTQDITFMAQAVDGAGNVGISRAKGLFFTPIPVDAGGDQTADEGGEITFGGSGPADITVDWEFGDGLGATGTYSPTHRYRDDGVFEVNLRVSDEAGGVGRDSLLVTVNNISPTVSIDRVTSPPSGPIFACEVVTFTASFTDPAVLDTHTATVDWDDGTVEAGTVHQGTGTGTISGSHIYTGDGTFTVQVCAADDDGGVGCDSVPVTVRTADFDADGDVDIVDIAQVVRRWGANTEDDDDLYEAKYDLNDDGIIDVADIQGAAARWRRSC